MTYKSFLKSIGINKAGGLLTRVSPGIGVRLRYLVNYGKLPNLRSPKTFDEKINWLKLHVIRYDPIYRICADKYLVRGYIKSIGCSEILNDLIAVYDHAEDINWGDLPSRFAMKWNFGAGYNIICSNKQDLDTGAAESMMKKWGESSRYLPSYEPQYEDIDRKIIVEKYMEGRNGEPPIDYKIYASYGNANIIMACVDRVIGRGAKCYYFDRSWNLVKWSNRTLNTEEKDLPQKPKSLDELFRYAEILSKPFPFVRVDLYEVNGKVYFGELTFTPAGGFDPAFLPEGQRYLGSEIQLPIKSYRIHE